MWLTGRLLPDYKKIGDFRKDNGLRSARCARALSPLAESGLLANASIAIDGSKFKAVNLHWPDYWRPTWHSTNPVLPPGHGGRRDDFRRERISLFALDRDVLSTPRGASGS
jgi:hypothetical protein